MRRKEGEKEKEKETKEVGFIYASPPKKKRKVPEKGKSERK